MIVWMHVIAAFSSESSNTISLDILIESVQKLNNEDVKRVIEVLATRKLVTAESATWIQNAEWVTLTVTPARVFRVSS